MKKLFLVLASFVFVSIVSGQTLAKKRNFKPAEVTDQMSVPAFRSYVSEVEKKISNNNIQISDLRFFVVNLQSTDNSKIIKRVIALQEENQELITDLDNFKKYGLGDWHLFQSEFNDDLAALSSDIEYMHDKLVTEYLLSSK